MQVTLSEADTSYNPNERERLKYDTPYNIQVGIEILLKKWSYGGTLTPIINGNEKNILENWYFAIMAYNGLSSRNDPNVTTGTPYQYKVFNSIEKNAVVLPFVLTDVNITYPNGRMSFVGQMQYETNKKTNSTQLYKVGDIITLPGEGNLRPQPNTDKTYGEPKALLPGTKVEIIDGTFEDSNRYHLFTWYQVKVIGTGEKGYIASSNF